MNARLTAAPPLRTIEVRSPLPILDWQAIATGELGGGLSLSRRHLGAREAFRAPMGLAHIWVAQGILAVATTHGEQLLGEGDLVVPGGEAVLRAGAVGAVLWIAVVPAPAPTGTTVTAFAAGGATILAGDLYTVKRRAAETACHLGMLHFAIPPGGGPIPHVHRGEDEVFVVLEGRLSLYADGVRTHAEQGDVICLPRGIPHGFHNLTDRPAAMLCLLAPGGGEEFFVEAGRAPGPGEAPKPDPAELRRILAVAERYGVEMRPDIADPYLP